MPRFPLCLLCVLTFAGCVPSEAEPAPVTAMQTNVAQPGFQSRLDDVLRMRIAGWLAGVARPEIAVRRPAAPVAPPPGRRTAPSSSVDWDGLVRCEASGNWAANTGNGFEGGPQFTHSTWVAYGGREFAEHAFQASRVQQIVVAERVLVGQGIGAWPVCGRRA